MGGDSAAEDEALDVLQSLAALSRQLALDAAEDDQLLQSIEKIDAEQQAGEGAE